MNELNWQLAGTQSPPPEEQEPKQGQEAPASGKVGKDKEPEFEKSENKEKTEGEKTLEGLPSNPERHARVWSIISE